MACFSWHWARRHFSALPFAATWLRGSPSLLPLVATPNGDNLQNDIRTHIFYVVKIISVNRSINIERVIQRTKYCNSDAYEHLLLCTKFLSRTRNVEEKWQNIKILYVGHNCIKKILSFLSSQLFADFYINVKQNNRG